MSVSAALWPPNMDPMAEPTVLTAEPTVLPAEPASAGDGSRDENSLTSDDSESSNPRCTTADVDSTAGSDASGDRSAAR
jgi:hypothetical protein